MSGIAGIVHFDGRPVEAGQVEKMTIAMDYRGPDGIRHWARGSVALGHCMLQTTPESLEESQPLANEDSSLVLVMDGRIDNWETLRRQLLARGARLRTVADAELLLRAYEAWGQRCLEHVEGDFALAIWDARRQALFCARDPVGNRQFHYHWNGTTFSFATELHPLLELPWVPERVNEDTVAEYLATEWLTIDTTLWQDIKRLKPAHYMTVSRDGAEYAVEYWAPDPFATLPCTSDDDYIEHYRDLFDDVVRRMSRAHRPLSFEVSGGLDSSSIFATAVHLQRNAMLPAPGLSGYTLDFTGDANADEIAHALQVGQFCGVAVHPVLPSRMSLQWYADMARRFRSFPDFPNGAMSQGIVQLARHSGSRVLVSGTGGDEWTGGADRHYAENLRANHLGLVGRLWMEEARAFGVPRSAIRFMRHGLLPLLPDTSKQMLRAAQRLVTNRGLRHGDWLALDLRARHESLKRQQKLQPMKAAARLGQHRQLAQVHEPYWQFAKGLVERRFALSGLEWRQPYWNQRMIEFAFATPEHLRHRLGFNRWLHRQAMDTRLPESVRLRQGKAEFGVTFTQHLPELKDNLAHGILQRRGSWLQTEVTRAMLDLPPDAPTAHWNQGLPWMVFGLDAFLPIGLA